MGKAVKVLVVAMVLFSAAAGGSWFMQQKLRLVVDGAADAHDKPGKGLPAPGAHGSASPGDARVTKAALRPPFVPEAENVSKMASNLQQQMESLKGREQQFTVRQKNIELIYQDIQKEQKALDEVRKQLNEELKALTDRMEALDRKSAESQKTGKKLEIQAKEIKESITEVGEIEKGRIKQMGTVYDAMEPEVAAQTLQDMVETGKLDMAVKILASMRERQAARVLATLPNPSVAVQLLDRLKGLKSASPKLQ